ncbi:protein of unknown function [Streptomyces sp. KY75]|nr:protein of unknown function [Streptomyces sp. KY75]CAD5988318.1 protein of unknown function [Streptomyces sp. KY70]
MRTEPLPGMGGARAFRTRRDYPVPPRRFRPQTPDGLRGHGCVLKRRTGWVAGFRPQTPDGLGGCTGTLEGRGRGGGGLPSIDGDRQFGGGRSVSGLRSWP